MELRVLRYVVALAEEEHFGRAARRAHVAQSALSHQVKQLERQLGVVLFDRTTRRVAITREGARFLDHARGILAAADRATSDMASLAEGRAGAVSVGFVGTATYDVLPRVAQRVRAELPDVELTLRGELLTPALLDGVQDGALDLALVRPGPDPQSLQYAARSFAPRVTAAQLDDALRPPASVREAGTEVPEDLPPVIEQTAREVTRGADTGFAQAVALQDWFRSAGGFTYSLEQRAGSGMDLLADFVTVDRVGYCEQFASAMATMARTLGIPARVAVGFLSPERQPDGRLLYSSDTRHAWPELYFSGAGWVRFEPTPGGRTGATPDYTRQSTDEPSTAPTPRDQASPEAAAEPEALPEDAAGGPDGGGLPWWSLLVPVALALAAAAPTAWRRRLRSRRLAGGDDTAAAEGAWAELRAVVLDEGRDWPTSRTPREQARRVVAQAGDATAEDVLALRSLVADVERVRYAGGTGGVREAVRTTDTERTLTTWSRLLRRTNEPRIARWRRRWWPASLSQR